MKLLNLLVLLVFVWVCFGCKSKPVKAVQPKPGSTLPVDSTRIRLELKVKDSKNGLDTIRQHTQTTLNTYENADSVYRSIPLDLP